MSTESALPSRNNWKFIHTPHDTEAAAALPDDSILYVVKQENEAFSVLLYWTDSPSAPPPEVLERAQLHDPGAVSMYEAFETYQNALVYRAPQNTDIYEEALAVISSLQKLGLSNETVPEIKVMPADKMPGSQSLKQLYENIALSERSKYDKKLLAAGYMIRFSFSADARDSDWL